MEIKTIDLSASLSEISGVLAALAFTVYVVYITGGRNNRTSELHGGVATTLLAAFATLVFCAISYLSPNEAPIVVASLTLRLPVFGISIMLLFYAMMLASLENRVLQSAVRLGRFVIVIVIPLFIVRTLAISVEDIHAMRCAAGCADNTGAPIAVAYVLGVGLVAWGVWLFFREPRATAPTARNYCYPAYFGVTVLLVEFVVESLMGLGGLRYWPSSVVQLSALPVMTGLLGVFMWLCARGLTAQPSLPPRKRA